VGLAALGPPYRSLVEAKPGAPLLPVAWLPKRP
jgi:hypothetical protein